MHKVYKPPAELRAKVSANLPVIFDYSNQLSTHYYELDTGKTNSKKPKMPDIVKDILGEP